MLQSISLLVDFGLPQSIGRSIASGINRDGTPSLVRTLEWFYYGLATLLAITVVTLSTWLASSWLSLDQLGEAEVSTDLRIMALIIAVRWPIALYQSVLVGFARIGTLSGLTAGMATASTIGTILVLAFIGRSMHAFLVAQFCFAVAHLLLARSLAWGQLDARLARFDLKPVRAIARFSAAMAGVTVSAAILSQTDRLVLTGLLPLSDFGYYVLATTVVGSLYLVVTPMFNIIYPHLTALHSAGSLSELEESYLLGTKLIVLIVFPIAVFLAVSGTALVYAWTGSSEVASRVGPLVRLMSMGSALHGAMYFPYALQLATGRPQDAFRTNLILLCVTVPSTYFLASAFGLLGGALSWLLFQVLYVLIGGIVVRNYLATSSIRRWMIAVVLAPAFLAFGVISSTALIGTSSLGYGSQLLVGVMGSLLSFLGIKLLLGLTLPQASNFFSRNVRNA
jgi:O-antigen/teichoic acid export membrane protein